MIDIDCIERVTHYHHTISARHSFTLVMHRQPRILSPFVVTNFVIYFYIPCLGHFEYRDDRSYVHFKFSVGSFYAHYAGSSSRKCHRSEIIMDTTGVLFFAIKLLTYISSIYICTDIRTWITPMVIIVSRRLNK